MSASRIPPRSHGARALLARRSLLVERALLPIERFIHSESVSAIILLAASIVALAWANSPWQASYSELWHTKLTFDVAVYSVSKSLHHWINDGLMAVFFFVVGLEMKAELTHGELSNPRQAALPAIAALGGMVVPALIYLWWNPAGAAARGWGIPMATDIAFAVGAMALLGERIPPRLRTMLLALATVDDIGAILVIAIFYTGAISLEALGISLVLLMVLAGMKAIGIRNPLAYAIPSVIFWIAVLESGIHATIAGVVLGLLTPSEAWFDQKSFLESAEHLLSCLRQADSAGDKATASALLGELEQLTYETESPVERRERNFRPWVSYIVLPLFALSNAGVVVSGTHLHKAVSNPVTAGVFSGLVAGKALGVVWFTALAVLTGVSRLPEEVTWRHVIGTGLLAGIGFTVSLFITGLAFEEPQMIANAKLGILAGSLVSGVAGYLVLRGTATGDAGR
jgi:NhaA family Na+:H+ antiporter